MVGVGLSADAARAAAFQGLTDLAAAGLSNSAQWVFTSRWRQQKQNITPGAGLLRTFSMPLNPERCRIKQGKRRTLKKTPVGTTFFHFVDPGRRANDIATMEMNGWTGNFDPRGDLLSSVATRRAWLNLLALTQEPEVLDDGTHNTVTITIFAPVFGGEAIVFDGFFDNVLDIDLEAENGDEMPWALNFTIQNTIPGFDVLLERINLQLNTARPVLDGQAVDP